MTRDLLGSLRKSMFCPNKMTQLQTMNIAVTPMEVIQYLRTLLVAVLLFPQWLRGRAHRRTAPNPYGWRFTHAGGEGAEAAARFPNVIVQREAGVEWLAENIVAARFSWCWTIPPWRIN